MSFITFFILIFERRLYQNNNYYPFIYGVVKIGKISINEYWIK